MQVSFCGKKFELDGPCLQRRLRDCNDMLHDAEALRRRLAQDGYLLVRALHQRDTVIEARRAILQHMRQHDCIEDHGDELAGVIRPGTPAPDMLGRQAITHDPRVLAVLEGKPIRDFSGKLFGRQARTFDYKWLRAVGGGGYTGIHYDVVYMGRGATDHLLTCWTPLGDIDVAQGTLAICVGSHNLPGFEKLRQTYGRMDVDRDRTQGWFSTDPVEIVDQFGGQWHTTDFRMGDVILFGMYTLHASTDNTTNLWRISSDTRFQPADEPIDPRWVGPNPQSHESGCAVRSIEQARAEWGV